MADQGRTVVQAARDDALSWPVVAAAFTSRARAVLPAQPEPVQALDGYGLRNPGNQRLRTRCATTRRARGHLDARSFR